MTQRLVLANGPARSGKDTLAQRLVERLGATRMGFADHLKLAAHSAHGLVDLAGAPLPYDAFELVKDQPRPEFFGLTPRAAYIATSETYLKRLHHPAIFGEFYLRAMLRRPGASLFVAPDSGFAAEAEPVLGHIGRHNALLLRIHAEARGKTFVGDSRSYIDLPGVQTVDLDNNVEGDPEPFLDRVEATVRAWLAGR